MDDQLLVDRSSAVPDVLSDIGVHVLNHLPDMFFVLSVPDFRYVAVNRKMVGMHKLSGVDADSILGRQPWEIEPGVRKRLLPLCQEAYETGEIRRVRNHQLVIPGSVSYWDFTLIPHKDSSGRVSAISTVGAVVTERCMTEDALKRSNTETAQILESITDGFVTLDRDYRYTYANRNAEELLRHSRDDLIGKRIWDVSPAALGTELHDACEKVVSEQASTSLEHYSARFDSWFENHIYPHRDGISIFFQDITERKRREGLSEALNTISTALNSSLDADEILDYALREASLALKAETAALNLLEDDIATVHSVYGLTSEWIGVQYSAKNGGVTEEIVRTGQTVIVTDAVTDHRMDRQSVEVYGVRAVLAVPLKIRGQVVGVMKFRYLSPRKEFSTSELDFASKLASSVSLALQNARLVADLQAEIEERRERDRLSDALNRINTAITSMLDIDEIINEAISKASDALRADMAAVNLREGDHWMIGYVHGLPPDIIGNRFKADRAKLSDLVASTGQVQAITDMASDERIDSTGAVRHGIKSVLAAPLTFHGQVTGILAFRYKTQKERFSEAEVDFAGKLGASVSLALENARLVGSLRDEVEDRTSREQLSSALNVIHEAINSTMDFDEIMSRALHESATALNAHSAAINLRDGDEWIASYIFGSPNALAGKRFSGYQAPVSNLVAKIGGPAVVCDTMTDDRVEREELLRFGIRAVLAAPLTLRGELLGVIVFRFLEPRDAFPESEVDFLSKLASAVTLGLENARLFADLQEEMDERSRINERLSTVLNSITDAYYSLDAEWRLVEVNDIAERALFDRPAEELAGQVFWDLYPQTTDSIYYEQAHRAVEQGEPVHFEAKSILRDKWWEVHAYPRDGRLEVYLRDITDRKQAEEQLRAHLHMLQQALVPPKPSIGDGYRLASAYMPAFDGQEIGGDFYDVYRTEEDRIVLLIGDVTGKGIEAAALASAARNTVRAFIYQSPSPGEVLNQTNAVLATHQTEDHRFATVFLAVIDPLSGEMRYACAGHPPALLYRTGGMMDFLSCGNMPVGIWSREQFREMGTTMEPGDRLIVYTDGVTDVRCSEGMLGVHGIERVVRKHSGAGPHELVKEILQAARNWAPDAASDDMAVIVIERLP